MISLRGPKFNIVAALIAVCCLAAGIYFTFFHSRGFVKNTAVIVSVEENEAADEDEGVTYTPTVEHVVNGVTYTGVLDTSGSGYKVGKTIKILYDPADPTVVHGSAGFGIYFLVVSAVILVYIAVSAVREKQSQKEIAQFREERSQTGYLPSEKGEERELYFLTDLGTAKYGHRIEDAERRVLYEAKMTKFTMTAPFGFDFIDHVRGTSVPHLVGHNEESRWNSLLIDNHYTFELDGVDVFRHLKENGVSVDTSYSLKNGKVPGLKFRILRDGEEIAEAEATCQYPHEEDEAQHKVAAAIPVQGFYRVWTGERNLDLLFVTLMAFARSGAADDKGGARGALFGTFRKE